MLVHAPPFPFSFGYCCSLYRTMSRIKITNLVNKGVRVQSTWWHGTERHGQSKAIIMMNERYLWATVCLDGKKSSHLIWLWRLWRLWLWDVICKVQNKAEAWNRPGGNIVVLREQFSLVKDRRTYTNRLARWEQMSLHGLMHMWGIVVR